MKSSTAVIVVVASVLVVLVVGIIGLGILGFVVYQATGSGPNLTPPQSFYTADDGKTWFSTDASRIPPFDYNGSPAVRVYVFKCGNSQAFPAYLERYTTEAAKKMTELMKSGSDDPMAMEQLQMTGVEVKKPGDTTWVLRNTPEAEKIMNDVKCPDGTTSNLEPISPED